jgi:hypothetical protein
MTKTATTLDIFKLLDQSNCQACGEKTCFAFAAAVFKGGRSLGECPKLSPETVKAFSETYGLKKTAPSTADERENAVAAMKKAVADLDLEAAARRKGGRFANGRLTVKVMGKDFSVDNSGRLYADIHVNPWVAGPFLDYVLYGKGLEPAGQWLSYRELKDGREGYPLFKKRCEEAMKRVADVYPELFDDMVHLFSGRQTDREFASDISVVLYPLPKVPIMICYWYPEEGMASTLNVSFDKTVEENLSIGSAFALGAGLANMFTKLAQRHGVNI